ncbi:MAG: hypothetical protein PVF70_00325 [Anaerolineales bacterium]|jgi:hypothetical protein
MEKHVTAVGILRMAFSAMLLLTGLVLFVLLYGVGWVISHRIASTILTVVAYLCGGFMVLSGLPGLVGGIALLRKQSWARILVLFVSAIDLLNVPFGTALGAYSIWVLLQPETVSLFEGAPT